MFYRHRRDMIFIMLIEVIVIIIRNSDIDHHFLLYFYCYCCLHSCAGFHKQMLEITLQEI